MHFRADDRTEEQVRIDRAIKDCVERNTVKTAWGPLLSAAGQHELEGLQREAHTARMNAMAARGELAYMAPVWKHIKSLHAR